MVLEIFEVEHCDEGFHLGFLIGQRFSSLIQNRVATDLILQDRLLPFSKSTHAQATINAIYTSNMSPLSFLPILSIFSSL